LRARSRRRSRIGRARLNGGRHARFEALLSSRVRSRDDLRSGQSLVVPGRCSPGLFPSRVCSSSPRVRCAQERTGPGKPGAASIPESSSPGYACLTGLKLRPWGLEPTARRSGGRSNRFDHRRAATPCRALSRSARAPVANPRPWRNESVCPRPLSAAPRASRVLRPRAATGGRSGGPRRRSGFGLLVGSPLAR